jgi:hypothetical protein
MQFPNLPQFLPSGSGLGASYLLNFASDLSAYIPMSGTWQGDPKKARSLYIDNYDNNFDIVISGGGVTTRCPAYSIGYVDVSSADACVLTSAVGGSVNIKVETAVYTYGFTSRGNAPAGSGDDLAAKVAGLYHFEGQNDSAIAVDSSIGGFGNLQLLPTGQKISTLEKKFGTSSCAFAQTASSPVNAPNSYTFGTSCTIEGFFKCTVFATTNRSFVNIAGLGIFIGLSGNGSAFRLNSSGCLGPLTNNTSWQHFALVQAGTQRQLYIEGVMVASSTESALVAGTHTLTFGDSAGPDAWRYFLDELRITNDARYLTNFTPPVQAFSI